MDGLVTQKNGTILVAVQDKEGCAKCPVARASCTTWCPGSQMLQRLAGSTILVRWAVMEEDK